MKDKDKTYEQLITELTQLRQRIAELEATGRKRNQFEESLRTERDKAQKYLNIAEVMLVVLNKKGEIILINRKGNQILGYKEGELIGKNWFTTCLPTPLRKNVKDVFKKLMAGEGKQAKFYENPVLTKSGTERIIAWHNTLLKDAQGTIIGTLSSGEDITERKQAEEEIERLASFPKLNPMPIVEVDKKGQPTYTNPAAQQIFPDLNKKKGKHPFLDGIKSYFPEFQKTTQKYLFREIEVDSGLYSQVISLADPEHIRIYAADITERKRSEEFIQVRMLLMEFAATHSLSELLQRTLDEVCKFTNSSVGFYHFVEADQKTLSLQAWSTRTIKEFCTATGEGMHYSIDEAGVWVDCIRERRPVIHNDYASLPHRKGMPEGHTPIIRELVVPIMRNDRFVAILGVGNKLEDYVDQDVQIVSYLADVAWEIAERKQAEEDLQHSYQQMQDMLTTTVNALASTVEMKDQYTAGHQPRGTQLACAIAEEMGLPEEQIEGIRMAGLIHDIGKIMVPAEILNKPGPLTEIQYEMVKMHPQAAFDILKGITFAWPVAEIVLQHHERIDGSGYPQGLSGDTIMVEAKILAVADVVEAMVSHRPYRAAHDITEALAEISQNKGILYDPVVVDACLKVFAEKRFEFEQVRLTNNSVSY